DSHSRTRRHTLLHCVRLPWPTMPSDGRVVLITGAANGIGRGIASVFARAGCKLALLDVNAALLERTAAELNTDGADVLARMCDVRSASDIQAAVDETVAHFGQLDVAVSNAGVYP